MGNLSKNFSGNEIACPCGCGLDRISLGVVTILEILRHFECGRTYDPGSACRCLEHNELVQSAVNPDYVPYSSKSKHMPWTPDGAIDEETGLCTAVDLPSSDPKKLYEFLDALLPDTYGLGIYSWGVHADTRPVRARW